MATFDINDVARRVQYTSTGQTGPFNFNFQVNASSELLVYIDDTEKTETTHYTVSLNADGTGSVTFTSATTTGELITIIGDQALSRTTVFQVGQVNNPTSLETEFDNTLIRQQQIKEITDRALQLKPTTPRTVTGSGTSGPLYWPYDATASNNASRVIAYDSNGTSLELGPTTANLSTLAGISSDISTVAGISSDITSVAADASDIGIVSTNIASVNTVATNINDVIAVANDLNEAVSEVETVANDLNEAVSEIDTVATSITNVDAVGNNISNVNTVAGISSNVTTVAGISANVTTVAGVSADIPTVAAIDTDVTTVAGISGNVTTVAGISSDVTAVANDSTDIGTVATNIANVNTVAGISANVTTVAGISSDVTAVAADATDIGTVATNITNVNNVGGSIANVNTVASNISGVNSFAERYRVDSADPTTSLDQGDLAYNTTANALKYYDGSAWQQIVAGGLTDIVQDGTPQLGGNLDLNSNDITGTGNLNITGNVSLTGTVDGRDVATDGTKLDGIATSATANPNAIDNVVEDTTPQLGGNLDTNGNDINFGDNDKAVFGTGNDLEIFHDGSQSIIADTGTGDLYLLGSDIRLRNQDATPDENMAVFTANGSVDLYYDNSKKFETTSTGVDVTGVAVTDGVTSSGDVLVNTTSTSVTDLGLRLRADVNLFSAMRDSNPPLYVGRDTTDGDIARFYKDGSQIGSIGSFSSLPYFAGASDGILIGSGNVVPSTQTGAIADNTVDLGASNRRFEKLYLGSSAVISEQTLTDGATISWDVSAKSVAKVTLGGNRTLSAPSNALDEGQFISLLVIQDGTGSRTLTWNAVYEFASDTAPTLTTTASKGDLFVFRYNGSKWLEVGRNLNLTLS